MAKRGTRGLRCRNGVWHIQKHVRGYGRLYESTGTSDLAEAERYLARRIEQIRQATVYGETPIVTFRDAATKFIKEKNGKLRALDRAATALDHVMPYIGHLPLHQVHSDTLVPFQRARRKAGMKAGTINRDLDVVRAVLNRAARVWRHPNGQPFLGTAPILQREKGPSRKAYPLNRDEQQLFIKELPGHLARMTLFALNTGLRDQELCQLRWDWEVDVPELGTSVFIIPDYQSKNGDERVLVLNRVARSVVEAQRGLHRERVFTYKGRPAGRMLNTAWKRARDRAGLPQLRVHDLRHTFGHRLRAAGVHLEDRKALLGHRNGDVTTHYSAPDLRRMLEYVERICDAQATVLRAANETREAKSGQRSEAKRAALFPVS